MLITTRLKKRINKKIILGFNLIFLTSTSLATTELPGKGISVQPLQSTIGEETFQTLIVCKALEKLGYDVKSIEEVDYNVAYATIASGDATFMAVNWVPLHNVQYKAEGGDKTFYRKGTFVKNAVQGYLIDKKTAEKYHINNIAQLRDPKLAELFDSNGNGKADLTGCNPGWGCEKVINHQLKSYGLENTVEQNQGNYTAMMADTIARYREGNSIFYYTWTPYWVNDVLKPGKDVIWLQVPFSALNEDGEIDTQLPNGRNYGFPPSSMHIVANRIWAEKNPAAAALFAVMQLPVADINAQNMRMHAGKDSEEDIEHHANGWINAHQKTFDGWLNEARKAAKQKSASS
ncbi:glycine betaine/L-proline ABC transporter substrate-binding protein ProX [Xenorhabdus budapestensis]|uniref:Glycine betaine/L-proline ABC transporter substrate-binding protein ProX n=1 Tax=Xenorhabdus budapestensis TaxID=290110 RepID=A0ABX7VJJ3_XENBU|nr:glycine betaine/L-proline ABC transporter substrate-binding protein ProX [Xenorhabdus budapestensis]QTL38944.1 glycine betaine/L-proline ABC transporter substrate-binding protein ProX [Xenorhabdus budapestensis]